MSSELPGLSRLALDAALRGAEIVTAATREDVAVRTKSSHRDLVTDVDAAAELAVTSYIRQHRPHDPILAEESGVQAGSGSIRWVIDPLDGTANFVHHRPDYAVAVAAEIDGRMTVGAIVKPATSEWIACDETTLVAGDGTTAAVSAARRLQDCLVSVSVSISEARRPLTLAVLTGLLPEVQDFRRTGSTSCDLFAVATGQLDAYVGIGSNPWDIAAGWAVVRAAGGSCLRFPVAGGQEAFVIGAPEVTEDLATRVREHAQRYAASRAFPAGPPRPATGMKRNPANALSDPQHHRGVGRGR